MYMETTQTESAISPSAQTKGDTIDLSSELEQQLDSVKEGPGTYGQDTVPPAGEETEGFRKAAPKKRSEKTASLISESKFLRYIADLRKADSELALAKAESAELVHQIDNFREHYTEYEQKVSGLINEQDQSVQKNLETLTDLAHSIQSNSDSLSSRIDGEIERLTSALESSIQGSVKDSCDQELARVKEATDVLLNYTETVKKQSIRFQNLERFKFALFIISSVSSPIVLILFILNLLHVF